MKVSARHRLLLLALPLACLCVAGYRNLKTPFGIESLPRDLPLIGAPRLLGSNKPQPGIPAYFLLEMPVCNPGPDTLHADVWITSGESEFTRLSGPVSKSAPLGGFGAPAGTYCGFGLCDVKQKRSQTIRLRVLWRRGATSGVLNYTIPPSQDDTVQD